jgi:hypothetical protein
MTFCKTGKTVTKTYQLMHVSDMFSAKLLAKKKKTSCLWLLTCLNVQKQSNFETFLESTVKNDGVQVYNYVPETEAQSSK